MKNKGQKKIVDEKLKQAQKVGKRKSQKNTENGGRLAHQKSTGSKEKALHKSAKVAEKRMEELEEISKPTKERQIHFKISSSLEMYNPVPIMSDNLNKKVSNKVIFENAKFKIPLGKKVAITGANGTGKTTLLKMILNKEEGIEISPKVQIGYFAQNGYKFEKEQNVLEFLRKASDYSISEIRSMIAMLGIKQNVITREMKTLSGGEVIKILLCKMLLGRYNDNVRDFAHFRTLSGAEDAFAQFGSDEHDHGKAEAFDPCADAERYRTESGVEERNVNHRQLQYHAQRDRAPQPLVGEQSDER